MRHGRSAAALVLAMLLGGPALAHHSYAEFDTAQTVSVEGTVTNVLYANPHVMLQITTGEAKTYAAEWANVGSLQAGGVSQGTLRVGDRLIVSGNPARDPQVLKLARLSEVQRPADGWRWRRGEGASVGPR